jgi:protein-L-isoaspartate(D-aspartate) O-methyltransferase
MSSDEAPLIRTPAGLGDYFAELVTTLAGVRDARLKAAFAAVPREKFVGPGPWPAATASGYVLTPGADLAFLYADIVVGILPERKINNGQPSFHAKCLGAASIGAGDTVIHVGAGAGYYSAIMAELTGPSGRVEALDIEPDLAARAARNLGAWPWAQVQARSGLEGALPQADVIYVNAGVDHIATGWLEALKPGGRLVVPLTTGARGVIMVFTARPDGMLDARFVCPTRIIPCAGGQEPARSERLRKAFDASRGRVPFIRSLRRGTQPDASLWLEGEGWWLSTEAL